MATLWLDIFFSIRTLSKNKGFAFLAVLIIALGIGPNTAIFSVLYAALLEPPDWGNAERVVILRTVVQGHGKTEASIPDYLEWKRETNVFSDMQGALPGAFNIAESEEPELVRGTYETRGMWGLLGQKMALGRDFLPEDTEPGKTHVVMLAHRLWATRFGSDPHIIGKTVRINSEPYTYWSPQKGPVRSGLESAFCAARLNATAAQRPQTPPLDCAGALETRSQPGKSTKPDGCGHETAGKRVSGF